MLGALVAGNPKFMAAYDLLAQTLRAQGKDEEAKVGRQDAVAISPHMVRRLRHLGDVALAVGDVAGAEQAYKQVVAKARHSEFRDPADHVNLVRTLVKKGDATAASAVVRDLERSLRSTAGTEVCRAYASAMVLELKGDALGAAAELAKAMDKLSGATGMSGNVKLALAHSCLVNRLDEQAHTLCAELTADPASGVSESQVLSLYEQADRPELLKQHQARVDSAVDAMVRKAAEKSRQGDLRGAVDVLLDALQHNPDPTGLWTATATAVLRHLADGGWDAALYGQCTALLRRIREHNAAHPLLPGLLAQYVAVRKQHGAHIAAAAAPAPAHPSPSPSPSAAAATLGST